MLNKRFSVTISDKIKKFKKTVEVDSDKSISIRSFLIGAISHNISKVKNVLESDDVFSTIKCLKKLGIKIKKIKPGSYDIFGQGLGSLFAKKNTELDFGNSGTLARLLIGILSTTPNLNLKIKGDHSLNKRSMKRLIDLMSMFGAEFFPKNKFNFPIKIISSKMPIGINYEAGSSAQLKSAVMLAGLNSYGTSTITEKKNSRNHTENILIKNTKAIKIINKKEKIIKIFGKNNLHPLNIDIPADPSAAAFFTALTLLNKNSLLIIKNVGLNPTRIGFYELLKKHGAKIIFKNIKIKNNEPVGDIQVLSSKIKAIQANKDYYVKATDEYPIMFVIAALSKGISNFHGISQLSNKESSRAYEMKKILTQVGIKCKLSKDQMKIYGNQKINYAKKTINVPSLGDHRICMSTVILSLITGVKSNIKNFETVKTSSPNFLDIIKSLGGKFEIKKLS